MSRARADELEMGAEWGCDRARQDEKDVGADAAHGFGQAIAGGTKAAGNERRKFPAKHEDAHKLPT